LRNQLAPADSVIIVYYDNRFALLTTMKHTEMLLTLSEEARKKILDKIRRLRHKGLRKNKFTFWRERRAGRCKAPRRRRCGSSSRSGNAADARPPPRSEGRKALRYTISHDGF
jgi:hypothetical protein